VRLALFFVRAFLALVVFFIILSAAGFGVTWKGSIGPVELDGRTVSVEVRSVLAEPVTLCPDKWVSEGSGGGTATREVRGDCHAARMVRRRFGPDAGVPASLPVRMTARTVGGGERWGFGLIVGLGVVAALLGCFALERMLAGVRRGDPFTKRNVFWMRVIAASVAIVSIGMPLLARPVVASFVANHGPDFSTSYGREYGVQQLEAAWTENLIWWLRPVALVFVLLAIAEVWRAGLRLQEDAEVTI
jgi:hypothetical protein